MVEHGKLKKLLAEENIRVKKMVVEDSYGNTVDLEHVLLNMLDSSLQTSSPSIDRML